MADTTTPKKLVILGSTGSIGVNSLHVVDQFPSRFKVVALSAHRNTGLLLDQCRKFRPRFVAVTGRDVKLTDVSGFSDLGITVFAGEDALIQLVRETEYDMLHKKT